jgi:hypothetical protein
MKQQQTPIGTFEPIKSSSPQRHKEYKAAQKNDFSQLHGNSIIA